MTEPWPPGIDQGLSYRVKKLTEAYRGYGPPA